MAQSTSPQPSLRPGDAEATSDPTPPASREVFQQPAPAAVVTAIATSSLATLGEHEQAAIRELGAYVREASQLAAAASEPAANTVREINPIATQADEYLRITLGQDRFNQLCFLAARDRRATRNGPWPSPGAPDN